MAKSKLAAKTPKKAPKRASATKGLVAAATGRKPQALTAAKAKAAPTATPAPKAKSAPKAPPPTWTWHEVMTNDVVGAKAFYGALFGWSAQDVQMPTGPYTLFTKGAEQVGGAMAIPQHDGAPVCPPHWLSYVRVDDVDATVARARELGARVDVGGMDVPGVGRFAILGDPTGATFAVFKNA